MSLYVWLFIFSKFYLAVLLRHQPIFCDFHVGHTCSFFFQLCKDWFAPAEASLKRAHIKKLIYEIAESNSQKVSASDERDSSESAGVDESFNGKEFLHEICNSADTCHDSYSNSTADKEFDTTPLAANPLPSLPWYGEPNALYDSGDNARLLTVGDYHPEQQIVLYNPSKNVMSPIEVITFTIVQIQAFVFLLSTQKDLWFSLKFELLFFFFFVVSWNPCL